MKFLWCLFIVSLCAAHTPSFWALNASHALPKVNIPTPQDASGLNTKTGSHGETNRRMQESRKEVTVYMRGQKGRGASGGDSARQPQKNSAAALVNNPSLFMLSTTVFSGSFALALAFLL